MGHSTWRFRAEAWSWHIGFPEEPNSVYTKRPLVAKATAYAR